MTTNIACANIVTAHKDKTVGSKIIDDTFWEYLAKATEGYQWPADGQGFIEMNDAIHTVSCGVTKRANVPFSGYHIVNYREGPALFVDRKYASVTENLACVVYTKEAYFATPNVDEAERKRVENADYILIAVLAGAGPKSPLSAGRFVSNLAGDNNAFKPGKYTIEKAVEDAKEIVAYGKEWVTVADRVKPDLYQYADVIGAVFNQLSAGGITEALALKLFDSEVCADIIRASWEEL